MKNHNPTTASSSSTSATPISRCLYQYQARDIRAVLACYNITTLQRRQLLHDETNRFDIYFYPVTQFSDQVFMRDSIDYFLIHDNKKPNRRVAYLLQEGHHGLYSCIVIQLCGFNQAIAKKINTYLIANDFDNTEDILKHPKLNQLFKSLYKGIHCLYLGSQLQQSLVTAFKKRLRFAYATNLHMNFLNVSTINRGLLITELVKNMLITGQTDETGNIDAVYSEHLHMCAEKLDDLLHQLSQLNKPLYKSIKQSLVVLFKYQCLLHQRQTHYGITSQTLKTLSLDQIETMLHCDQKYKKTLYKAHIKLGRLLSELSLETLTQLLVYRDNPERMRDILEKKRRLQYTVLKQWETMRQQQGIELKKSWSNYLPWLAQRVSTFAYNHTFIGLGAELCRWLGGIIADSRLGVTVGHILKKPLQITTRAVIFCFTFSSNIIKKNQYAITNLHTPQLIHRFLRQPLHITTTIAIGYGGLSQAKAKNYVKGVDTLQIKPRIPMLFKWAGSGIGTLLTYSLGFYSLSRMLIVSVISSKFRMYIRREKLNDNTASFSAYEGLASNPSHIIRGTTLTLSAVETAYTGNTSYILSALGGIAGSEATTQTVKRLIPPLRRQPDQPPTEEQVITLFFLALSGNVLGHYLVGRGLMAYQQGMKKLRSQQLAQQAFTDMAHTQGLNTWGITFPESHCSSSFWLNTQNSMQVTWIDQNHRYHEATCEIITVDPDTESGLVICEEPTDSFIPLAPSSSRFSQ